MRVSTNSSRVKNAKQVSISSTFFCARCLYESASRSFSLLTFWLWRKYKSTFIQSLSYFFAINILNPLKLLFSLLSQFLPALILFYSIVFCLPLLSVYFYISHLINIFRYFTQISVIFAPYFMLSLYGLSTSLFSSSSSLFALYHPAFLCRHQPTKGMVVGPAAAATAAATAATTATRKPVVVFHIDTQGQVTAKVLQQQFLRSGIFIKIYYFIFSNKPNCFNLV